MNKRVHSYRVIVEKEQQKKGFVYVAYAPTLGISDFGKTIDEAVKNIEKAIKLLMETLIDLKKPGRANVISPKDRDLILP